MPTRGILSLTSVIAALFILTSCGGAGPEPTEPQTLSLDIVEAFGTSDSLRYVVEATGNAALLNVLAPSAQTSSTFIFECTRTGDGTSVLTLATESGDVFATATRTGDEVTLETDSGLHATSSDGTIQATEGWRQFFSIAEAVLLDANLFSHYAIPADAPDDQGLKEWKAGLDLVNTAEPVASEQAISPQRIGFCYDVFGTTICIVFG